jgi:hypothetical protein
MICLNLWLLMQLVVLELAAAAPAKADRQQQARHLPAGAVAGCVLEQVLLLLAKQQLLQLQLRRQLGRGARGQLKLQQQRQQRRQQQKRS